MLTFQVRSTATFQLPFLYKGPGDKYACKHKMWSGVWFVDPLNSGLGTEHERERP